jgi:bifunctional non-homologous end joining protein LigD
MTLDLRPMLVGTGAVPDDEQSWAYEPCWCGLRALAVVDHGAVQLVDRHGDDISERYPEILAMGAALGVGDGVIDGEFLALDADGLPDLDALQERRQVDGTVSSRVLASEIPVTFLAFDLLSLDGRLTVNMSYSARRTFLDGLALDGPAWATSPWWSELTLADALQATADRGVGGVVAKRLDARYQPGARSDDWRTIAGERSEDLVVGAWVADDDSDPEELVSLLVGRPDAAGLRLAGSVSTGISPRRARLLRERLDRLGRDASPFVDAVDPVPSLVHWVEPRVTVRVSVPTSDDAGRIVDATYRGIRADEDHSPAA